MFKRHDVIFTSLILAAVVALEMLLRSLGVGTEPVILQSGVADLLEYAAAAGLAVWLLWRYWYFLPNFYRFCLRYPGLMLILVLIYALVYGQLGTSFGVHYQFWHDDILTRFGAACAVTLLLGILGMLAYYLDPRPAWTAALVDAYFGGGGPRLAPPVGGAAVLVPRFYWFRSPNVIRLSRFLQLSRWAFLTLLAAPAILPAVFTSLPRTPPVASAFGASDESPLLTSAKPLMNRVVTDEFIRTHYVDVLSYPLARAVGIATWVLGIVLGVFLIKTLCWLGERVRSWADTLGKGRFFKFIWNIPGWLEAKIINPLFRRIPPAFLAGVNKNCYYHNLPVPACPIGPCPAAAATGANDPLEKCEEHKLSRAAVVNFYFIFLVFYLIVLNFHPVYDWVLSAAFSICALLSLLAMTYAWFARFYARWQFPTLVLIVAWVALWNYDPYKLRFENMDEYYEAKARVPLRSKVRQFRDESLQGATVSTADGLVSNNTARTNWLTQAKKEMHDSALGTRQGSGEEKPKLVVVAVSGGATRAGYWAGVVLERLEDEFGRDNLGDFGRNVRIITGSSGGMLGTAHYVLHRVEHIPPEAPKPDLKDEDGHPIEKLGAFWVDLIPRDSLRPVAKYLALKETWRLFLPRLWFNDDRGIRLEQDWKHLRFPLRALSGLEEGGYIPSLIFSPMTIEDGRQLLISNLDLRVPPVEPGETHARWVGMSAGSALDPGFLGQRQVVYSISGLEFFRIFPNAKKFLVSTAVRMGASFPFVSPAVNLPTYPPHRVVDAGYYDNYGIQAASAWIYDNREWLMDNTSGVVLVQIRDSTSIVDRIGIDDSPASVWQKLGHGFQFFTSPIEGISRARFTSGSFRNDQTIQFLSDMFTREMRSKMPKGESRRFFTTLVLENAAEVSLTPHKDEWPGVEFVSEKRGGTDAAGGAGDHRGRQGPSTGVSMTWYLTRAERDALDFSIPEPTPGSRATEPAWRNMHIVNLREAIDKMSARDPRRMHAMNDYQRVSNYEKIQQLKAWWKLGLQDRGPALPPVPSPPQ